MNLHIGIVFFLLALSGVVNFTAGYWMAPTSIDRAWEFIEKKVDKNELYFSNEVESIVKQSMNTSIKHGFTNGRETCGKIGGSRTVITVRLLPHGVEVADTTTFDFE